MRKILTLPLFLFAFIFGDYFEWYETVMILAVALALAFEPELIKFEKWLFPRIKKSIRRYLAKKVRNSKVLMRWINNPGTTLYEAFTDSFNKIPVEVRTSWRNSIERGDYSA